MEELSLARLGVGGAGHKALLLLEGAGECYVQDRGLSRWDTCGAQGVLEAHGGAMVKLHSFMADGALDPYSYIEGGANSDFVPGLAALSRYNAARAYDGDAPQRATDVEQLLPYANTCGVLALPRADEGTLERYRAALLRAAARHDPAYD